MKRFNVTVLLLIAISHSRATEKLKSIFSWKALEFNFPSEHARLTAIKNGDFIPGNSLPIDMDVYQTETTSTVFISIPRFQDGVPVTVGYVTEQVSEDGNPIIAPYPSWRYNKINNCDTLTSVFRVEVDECGRLWVLDTGMIGSKRVCHPQIHIFSLEHNTLITRYQFPTDQYKTDSLFVTVVLDIRDGVDKCRNTFAYIADVSGFALLVYDFANSRSWKIVNNLFYPYPQYGTFHIKNDTFDLMDGIVGLALGPIVNGDRILYFHSLASIIEGYVPVSVIRDYELFTKNSESSPRSFVPFEEERNSQSVAEAMDRNGVLFFGLLSNLAIGCWNSKHYPEFGGRNLLTLVVDPETLQFPSGMKITTSKNGLQELWVLSNSFQKYMTNSMRTNETNFRIQAGFIDQLVHGTICDATAYQGDSNQAK
ncbi:Protein yellow [Habropoda laboriosa]|uniref:Protein yellow n=1 Tax=Habropoda laboriosa TaxID=597456 RepID=A0A0L7QPP5_9HYME|nr:Protein yellow [Habropoda laboriosa]